MVGSSLKPSCGRHVTPTHSIPSSVAHLWREVYKYYSYIIRGEIWFDDVLVRKDGLFVIDELLCMNPDALRKEIVSKD